MRLFDQLDKFENAAPWWSEGECSFVGNGSQQEFPNNLMDELESGGINLPDIGKVQQMSKEEFKACIQQQFKQLILELMYPALASIYLRVHKQV